MYLDLEKLSSGEKAKEALRRNNFVGMTYNGCVATSHKKRLSRFPLDTKDSI
jgi:hypothetical protein